MLQKAVDISAQDEVLIGDLADAYRAAGQKEQANTDYDKAIQLAFQQLQVNPKLADVTIHLALYYAKKGDSAHALTYTKQARALDPEALQILYYQVEVESLAGHRQEAL